MSSTTCTPPFTSERPGGQTTAVVVVDLAGPTGPPAWLVRDLAARLPEVLVLDVSEPAALPHRATVALVADPHGVRRWAGLGALVLAVAADMNERVSLLDAGASSATTPCGGEELAARVHALLRRA